MSSDKKITTNESYAVSGQDLSVDVVIDWENRSYEYQVTAKNRGFWDRLWNEPKFFVTIKETAENTITCQRCGSTGNGHYQGCPKVFFDDLKEKQKS